MASLVKCAHCGGDIELKGLTLVWVHSATRISACDPPFRAFWAEPISLL